MKIPKGVTKRTHNKTRRKADSTDTAKRGRSREGSVFIPMAVMSMWLICFCSALGVVYSTYQSRKAMQELEELRREASGLQVISGQYLLEKSSWGTYSRIEKIAMGELDMAVPASEQTVLVYRK